MRSIVRHLVPQWPLFIGRSASLLCIGNFACNGYTGHDKFLDDSGLNEKIDWKCRVTYTLSFGGPSIKRGILGYASKAGNVGYIREDVAYSGRLQELFAICSVRTLWKRSIPSGCKLFEIPAVCKYAVSRYLRFRCIFPRQQIRDLIPFKSYANQEKSNESETPQSCSPPEDPG